MGDSYIEVLIERDKNKTYFLGKIASYVVAIILFLLALSTGFSPFLIGVRCCWHICCAKS